MTVDQTNNVNFRKTTENSSIHGVRQLSLTYHHSKFVLVGWICVICVALMAICYQITNLTSFILSYPSTIVLSIQLERRVFPTVTACNMGVYKKSVVETIDTFNQLSQAITTVSSRPRAKREATQDDYDPLSILGGYKIEPLDTPEETRQKRQSGSVCSTGCTVNEGFCYLPHNTSATNSVTQAYCSGVGGKLPFFSSVDQFNHFSAYRLNLFPSRMVWLGFWNYSPHNATSPGVWQDTNGTGSVLSFSNWCVNESNDNMVSEKCVLPTYQCWLDTSCNAAYQFICMCQCPTISIANGTVTINPVPAINNTAQFQCNSGYELVGSPILSCIINNLGGMSWDLPTPSCAPIPVPKVTAAEFIAPLENGNDNIAAASQLNSAMEILLSGLTQAQTKLLGFQQNDFVTGCLFSGIPCNNKEKLTLVQIPEFLNCYAFSHRDQTSLFTSERSGEKFGLVMTFNIQSEEYINTMSIPGVQLFVQDQFDPILPGSMGSIYSPGIMYYIAISNRIEYRLSVPDRHCMTSTIENSFNLFKNDTYFTEGCLRSFVQMNIIRNCGCGSAKYPLPNDNSKFCNLTTAKCATTYLASTGVKLIEEAQVVCPPACRSVSFDLITTFSRLSPHQSMLDRLNMTKTSYMKNTVMVKLFFATDTIMEYTENLNSDVMSVLANIGGSLGCIAGISMISLVEVIFMIAKGVAMLKNNCY